MSRFLIVAPIALVVTMALFFLMRYLISPSTETPEVVEAPIIKIGRSVEDTQSEPKRLVEPPAEEPPQAKKPDYDEVRRKIPTTNIPSDGPPVVEPPGKLGMGLADGGATPIIRPKPEYPGCGQGTTGEVVLEYVVEPNGSVSDVRVVRATSSCFARAAERATTRWHYRPKVVNGEPVRSDRLRVTLVFYPE